MTIANHFLGLGVVPLLSADEEKALARRIQAGDLSARDQMVRSNLPLVVKLAQGWLDKGLDFPDLIMEGCIGLIYAAEKYDPDRGLRFSTYASRSINRNIHIAILDKSHAIRLPRYVWDTKRIPLKEKTINEIDQAKAMRRKSAKVLEFVAYEDPEVSDPGDIPLLLSSAMAVLDDREREVIRRYYGVDGCQKTDDPTLGEEFGVTKTRIHQIRRGALEKMRIQLLMGEAV